MAELSDRNARERAVTATDRNIVVTAGAGTGKTTLLVDRLVHLLLRHPDPLSIGEIVALTFTNKAANDMKLRLRERLLLMMTLHADSAPTRVADQRVWEQMVGLMRQSALTKTRIDELAARALRELEKSQIGTIHSFAAHLLRLYPLESGVDPSFQEDDGTQFREHFQLEWEAWLDQQLGPDASERAIWQMVLQTFTLDDVRDLAAGLSNELVPLTCVGSEVAGNQLPPPIQEWVLDLAQQARALREKSSKITTIERMLDGAASRLERLGRNGTVPDVDDQELDRDLPNKTTTWSPEDYERAKDVLKVAQAFRRIEPEPLTKLLGLLVPYATGCRQRFVERGCVSFDGLLARARDLLRNYPHIRRELKTKFKAVLVDEFQDTDPVQYELILYLVETTQREARDWRTLDLEAGKLFIVGDPKQSIYAFRRADMEAYDRVVEERILGQGVPAERQSLQANFRTHVAVLHAVNGWFARLFPSQAVKGLHPKHEPLLSMDEEPALPTERVEVRLVRPSGSEMDSDTATRSEAEELGRWLSEEVLWNQEIREDGVPVKIRPRHVAILFRTFTMAREYLEALRRHGIPYVTEGEKHFYERQEVLDLINLLRTILNPHDHLALVGVLRSPLGAVSDREIAELARQNHLDYRYVMPATTPLEELYALLRTLHKELPRIPVAEVIAAVFARLPLLELALASADKEQAFANLLKLRDLAGALAARPDMTLRRMVALLTERILHPPDEAESPLMEEVTSDGGGDGAVRLLSIHKAKGLEFPMVILAGLHRGSDRRLSVSFVQHDWSSGVLGVRCGGYQTLGGLYVGAKLGWRQRAELHRVLYVGMTRAKRRLVLSAGLSDSLTHASDNFLALLSRGLDEPLVGEEAVRTVHVGDTSVTVQVVEGREVPMTKSGHQESWTEDKGDLQSFLSRWKARTTRAEEARYARAFLSPTLLRSQAESAPSRQTELPSKPRYNGETTRFVGTLAHRVLQHWNFSDAPGALKERVATVCRQEIAEGWEGKMTEIEEELLGMLQTFTASEPYRELQRATILGREVPFMMPWDSAAGVVVGGWWSEKNSSRTTNHKPRASAPCAVMEGVIDVVYRLDGTVHLADYKTDRVQDSEVTARAAAYEGQARIYREAVSRCLGVTDVGVRLIFVRNGKAVSM